MTGEGPLDVPPGFWETLRNRYPTEDEWFDEREQVERVLRSTMEDLRDLYTLDDPQGVGGGGVVIRVRDRKLSTDSATRFAVLKIPRQVVGMVGVPNDILDRETRRLASLRHQNVIRLLTYGEAFNARYYVMEYLEGVHEADEYLAGAPAIGTLIDVLEGACSGLAYMHRQDTAHLDIKPSNILVAGNASSIVVADLGFAKNVSKSGATAFLGGTAGYMHPDLRRLILAARQSRIDMQDPNRQMRTAQVEATEIRTVWDIYALGVTTLVLLRVLSPFHPCDWWDGCGGGVSVRRR